MERTRKSPKSAANLKKKMTREQIQLAVVKKKECDARALKIVEQLLEPEIDLKWLLEHLQHINRCHMEDVIEERAISKTCGYVLCQKPLTVIIKQQYHISLRDKKVYDVSKRKNFCSSSCFGAANYLLEQLLTSPLWMREDEEIPTFKIFTHTEVSNVEQNNTTDKKENLTKEDSFISHYNGNVQDEVNIKIPQNDLISENKKEESTRFPTVNFKCNKEKSKKPKTTEKKRPVDSKNLIDVNLATKVEKSFQEWMTEESVNFLFGDDSAKQKAIEKIEYQNRHEKLCEKLNKFQLEDEQEDAAILEKPVLKPAPHFKILKEEGQKLDLKVRAFYQGKTTFEEFKNSSTVEDENSDANTFLPLTDVHAPQLLRRKIFLERLDQVLPDLLRTLTGNNEIYERICCNYTSVRCTAVKALVHTFSLSATNIIFKNAEWTLVGLIMIKMLSLIDPWLANLLITRQAYISMILSSYKLNNLYLNLFVDSFKSNVKNTV